MTTHDSHPPMPSPPAPARIRHLLARHGAAAGMFARGEFALGDSSALMVPQSAVVVRDGFSYVYRLGGDNRVAQLKVQTGRRSGEQIEVVSALNAEARLVASGAGFLNDGDLVRVVEDGKAVAPPATPAVPAFKNFLHPVTILCALPLALGGAFVGLLVAQKSFSMPSLIGLIMLMGIATKNSILLVEYAIVARRDRHLSRIDALLDACHKRARPIIMTTLAMGAGMAPISFGLGAADPSFRSPMSIAVIGGLITSTVLSLLVVPAVFTYVDDVGAWSIRMFGKLRRRAKPHLATAQPREPSAAAPPLEA